MGEFVQHPDDDQRNDTPDNTPKTGIDMEAIPSTAVCTYVGEGAANVVFELSNVEDHPRLAGTAPIHNPCPEV